jgi:hypothetical protein
MLNEHINFMFPPHVMEAFKASLQPQDEPSSADGSAAESTRPSKKPRGEDPRPLMPPCNTLTTLDARSANFATKCCNMYRESLPDEYVNHPVFAAGMEIDQSLHKFVGVRCRRREAFMKVLQPP